MLVKRHASIVIAGTALTWAVALAAVIVAQSGSARPSSSGDGPQAAAAQGYVGEDTCLTCHQDKDKDGYVHSMHGRKGDPRSPAALHGCETCHGPGKAHAESGDPSQIRVFSKLTPREVSAVCATCHSRGTHMNWAGSVHDERNLSCTTCHSIHHFKSEHAQLVKESEPAVCATCHRPEANKVLRSAHMPLREGKMTCSSCHNPHGSTNVHLLAVGNSVTESCTSCHAAQRGPFLWEHPVGREACTICHDPHGSSNDRMLVAKVPLLCQRCHIGTRHTAMRYDQSVLGTTNDNRLLGRGCINCHQNIHGSNHPSGNFFLR